MFVLFWLTLLFPGRGVNTVSGKITAEVGLCVVAPCSVQARLSKLQKIEWDKCEPLQPLKCSPVNCSSSNSTERGGRAFRLDPDLNAGDCSIIINDLTESDTGEYWTEFRYADGFRYAKKLDIVVKALTQKPTVTVSPLTEGRWTTLTCTAPGLCSGSVPKFTWTWRGRGESNSYIPGNITFFNIEFLTPFTQRHRSILKFNPSVSQQNGTEITCRVTFLNNITTETTVALTVSSLPKILDRSACSFHSKALTCVCISEGNPLPVISWPMLRNSTVFSVASTQSKHSVDSTIVVSAKDLVDPVSCVSANEVGRAQKDMYIINTTKMQRTQLRANEILPWCLVAVSLLLNLVSITCLIVLCNSRKKVKASQEDKTYMTLQKRHPSQEYDVLGQPRGVEAPSS